jgi:hypothetical protein
MWLARPSVSALELGRRSAASTCCSILDAISSESINTSTLGGAMLILGGPLRANSGHSAMACRTGQVDPKHAFPSWTLRGRDVSESCRRPRAHHVASFDSLAPREVLGQLTQNQNEDNKTAERGITPAGIFEGGVIRSGALGGGGMQNLSLYRNHSARIVAWLTILAIAVLSGWAAPAEARRINATIVDIGPIPYSPTVTSDVARLLITGTYNGMSLETANSALTIDRGGEEIIVRPSASVSSMPAMGMVQAKPGFISFGTAGSATFRPGDMLTFNLLFTGNVTVRTNGGLYLDIAPNNNNPSTNGALRTPGASGTFDTSYTIYNDLDTSLFSDTTFTVENLAFMGDITTSQLDALSLVSIAAGNLPSGAVLGSPSTFTLTSGELQSFMNPFPDPEPYLWDVALGQIFDPSTGYTYAFIDGYQGAPVPEPATWMLLASGFAVLGLAGLLRDRGRRATTAGWQAFLRHDAF